MASRARSREGAQAGGTEDSRTGGSPPHGALISPVAPEAPPPVEEPPVRTRIQPPSVPFPLPRRQMPRGLFERLKSGWSVALQKALTAEGAILVVALGVGA